MVFHTIFVQQYTNSRVHDSFHFSFHQLTFPVLKSHGQRDQGFHTDPKIGEAPVHGEKKRTACIDRCKAEQKFTIPE